MQDATRLPALTTPDPLADPANLAAVAFLGQYLNRNTRAAYTTDLRLYFAWCSARGLHPLRDVQRAHVQAFVIHLLEERGNSAASVVRRLGTISGYYDLAVLDRFIEHSPAHHLKLPKVHVDPARRTWLNRFELGALLRVAKAAGPADWALIALLGTIGMRVSATCNIRVEDITTTELGYRIVHTIGKGDKPSVKVLPIPVMLAVDAAVAGRTNGWLLLRRDGTQMTRRSADRVLQRLCREAGIAKKVSPHSLRRSFATLALQAGVDVRVVQDGMDHASTRTTLGYDRLGVELHAQASHTVAAMLASAS
jgi:site-specific recombinase XerD